MENNLIYIYVTKLIHFGLQLKVMQYCKSTVCVCVLSFFRCV